MLCASTAFAGFNYYPATAGQVYTNELFIEWYSGVVERAWAVCDDRPEVVHTYTMFAGYTNTVTTNGGFVYSNRYAVYESATLTNQFRDFVYTSTLGVTTTNRPHISSADVDYLDGLLNTLSQSFVQFWEVDTSADWADYLNINGGNLPMLNVSTALWWMAQQGTNRYPHFGTNVGGAYQFSNTNLNRLGYRDYNERIGVIDVLRCSYNAGEPFVSYTDENSLHIGNRYLTNETECAFLADVEWHHECGDSDTLEACQLLVWSIDVTVDGGAYKTYATNEAEYELHRDAIMDGTYWATNAHYAHYPLCSVWSPEENYEETIAAVSTNYGYMLYSVDGSKWNTNYPPVSIQTNIWSYIGATNTLKDSGSACGMYDFFLSSPGVYIESAIETNGNPCEFLIENECGFPQYFICSDDTNKYWVSLGPKCLEGDFQVYAEQLCIVDWTFKYSITNAP